MAFGLIHSILRQPSRIPAVVEQGSGPLRRQRGQTADGRRAAAPCVDLELVYEPVYRESGRPIHHSISTSARASPVPVPSSWADGSWSTGQLRSDLATGVPPVSGRRGLHSHSDDRVRRLSLSVCWHWQLAKVCAGESWPDRKSMPLHTHRVVGFQMESKAQTQNQASRL